MTRGRESILEDVRLIHHLHPVDSAIVTLSRKLQIARFEFQVDYARELVSRVDAGALSRDAAALEYIHAVFGMT